MSEYSRSLVGTANVSRGFRTLMAERVLRRFEAKESAQGSHELRRVALRKFLLRPVSERCVAAEASPRFPRLFASSGSSVKFVLGGMVSKIKRTAAARTVQRLAARFASKSSELVASELRGLRPVPVVASRRVPVRASVRPRLN